MPEDQGWPFRSEDQEPDAKPSSEREKVRWHSRVHGQPRRANYGRRRSDTDTRTTLTAKVIAGIVFVVNAFYLVGEALLDSGYCP
jgi:hypothetical protein